jgi:hypothetical protein
MKRKTVVLAVVLLLSVILTSFYGCKDNKPIEVPEENEEFTETDSILAKDGTTDYKIVLPADPSVNERYGASELIEFFARSTGAELTVISDTDAAFSDNAKFISIGENELFKAASVSFNKADYSQQGYKIKTVKQCVFILGGGEIGVLYGVYEFMHHQIGFEAYAPDELYTEVYKERKLLDIDLTDEPDIMWREPNYGPVNGLIPSQRMRFNNSIWITGRGNFVHNSIDEYFPYSQYSEKPEYYSVDKKGNISINTTLNKPHQLCYTAKGDADVLEEMRNIVFERIKTLVVNSYSAGKPLESVSFTHEDSAVWCQCDTCTAANAKYGTDAAVIIQFINPVAVRIKDWLAEEYPGAKLNIAIFAYVTTESAPVRLKSDGGYEAIDNTVVPEDNIVLFYAPYYANYHYSFDHKDNKSYKQTLDKWKAIADKIYLWTYSTNFHNYFSWYDSFNSMQSIYQMAKEYNAYYIFDQGRYNVKGLSGFDHLKIYLNSKLGWDVNVDLNKLTGNFFVHYFKDAYLPMQQYFEEYRVWMEHLRNTTAINGVMQNTLPYTNQHLPKQLLTGWMKYIESAYTAIEPHRFTNAELYQKLYDRITKESMVLRFYIIDLYANTYTTEQAIAMKQSFKEDASRLGFTLFSEMGSVDKIYSGWKI